MENHSSRTLKYALIAFCVIVAMSAIFLLSGILEGQSYGFRVVPVEWNVAKKGVITPVTEADLKESPALENLLVKNSSDSVRISQEEFDFYSDKYWYLIPVGNTTKRHYFEYLGTYFYLEFHEGDKTYPPPY